MKKRTKRDVILAFGEDVNDTRSLQELIVALQPNLPKTEVVPRPIILRRPTDARKLNKRGSEVASVVAAACVKFNVVAVLVHHDLDNMESRLSVSEPSADEAELKAHYGQVEKHGAKLIIALPAWELEAWWLMWPQQVARHRKGWRRLKDRSHTRVDRIKDPKELLRRETLPKDSRRVPAYSESDSPAIARCIREDGVVRSPRGKSIAFEVFVDQIDDLSLSLAGHV